MVCLCLIKINRKIKETIYLGFVYQENKKYKEEEEQRGNREEAKRNEIKQNKNENDAINTDFYAILSVDLSISFSSYS